MRHRTKGRKLKRTASHRTALMNALTTSLLRHKRIRTTEAKAKEARRYVEALITKAKKNDLHSMRQVMSHIRDKEVVKELFSEIVPKIGDRPGGKAEEQKEKREARRAQKQAEKTQEIPEAQVLEETPVEKNK